MRLFKKIKTKTIPKFKSFSNAFPILKSKHTKFLYMGIAAVGIMGTTKYLFDEYKCKEEKESKIEKIKKLKPSDQSTKRLRKKFEEYASTIVDGKKVMTFEDFQRSYGSQEDSILRDLFQMADKDKSNTIDFHEYKILNKLLSTPEAEMKLAFQLFDINGDGVITKSEFKEAFKKHSNKDSFTKMEKIYSGILDKFFAKDGGDEQSITYDKFVDFLQEVKIAVISDHWFQIDVDNKGILPFEQFEEIVVSHSVYGRSKEMLKEEFSDLKKRGVKYVTYQEFLAFNYFVNHFDKIHNIIISNKEQRLSKAQFTDKLGSIAYPGEVDMIFRFFDKNGDGVLDEDCFTTLQHITHPPAKKMTLSQSLLIGAVSAMIGATVVFPMDKIKTLLQSSQSSEGIITGMKNQFGQIIKKEGVPGLWRGLIPQLIGISPEKALKLTVNDKLRNFFRGDTDRVLTVQEEILAGMGTGIFQVTVTNPYELLKIKIQIQAADGAEKKSLKQVLKETGLRGLYRGLPATMLRDIPFNMIYFSSYAMFKQFFTTSEGLSPQYLLLSSFLAGVAAAVIDTPADTLKTRLQSGKYKYKGVIDAFTTIMREEGFSALLKGTLPRVLIIAPLFAITFTCFELFQRIFLPNTFVPLSNLQEDLSLIRGERLTIMSERFQKDWGIKL